MADVVAKLQVDSSQFDQRLKSAVEQMTKMEKEVRRTGASFAYADKEELEFIRSIGQMETKADSAKGKIAEMTKSFTELSLQYNRLTKEEKQGGYGRALASSLEQLKTRIKDSKSELADVEGRLTGVGDAFKQLGNKIGIPVEVFSKFGPILAAAGAAAKVAKDAFFANESMVDEWGRTVESAKSIYEGFVTSLNTGDFGGFLSRMSSISAAARKAYDELDRLGTMKTIQSPEMSRLQAENERNRMMLQTRRYIAPLDGSAGIPGMKNGQLLSDAQVKNIESELKNGIQRIAELVTNEVQQTTNAIEAEYNRQANVIGLNLDEFKKGTSSMAEFDRMLELAKKYYEFEDAHTTINYSRTGAVIESRDKAVNPYEGYQKWNVFRVDGESYKKLVQLIQQRDQQMAQAYSMQSQAYRAINRAEGISVRGGKSTQVPVEPVLPEGSAAALKKQIADLQKQWDYATSNEDRSGIQKQIDAAQKALDEMSGKAQPIEVPITFTEQGISNLGSQIRDRMSKLKIGSGGYLIAARNMLDFTTFENLLKVATERGVQIDPEWMSSLFEDIKVGAEVDADSWQALVDDINKKLAELDLPPIKLDVKTGAVTKTGQEVGSLTDNVNGAISAFGQLGGAIQQIDDPSAKVAGIVMGAVAEVAGTFAASLKGTFTPWDWIAAALSGTATMISTITAIKSATSGNYAGGGKIPGNSFSGDNMRGILPNGDLIGLDAGEVILNRAQQGSIAGQLQNNPLGNLQLTSKVRGSDLLVVLDNTNSSRGGQRGMYVNVK